MTEESSPFEGLAEDNASYLQTKGYKSLDDAIKTLSNQESLLGKKIDEFKGINRPGDIKEYGLETKEDILKTFHEIGLSKSDAARIYEQFQGELNSTKEAAAKAEAEAFEKNKQALLLKYGGEAKMNEALKAAKDFADKRLGKEYSEFTDFIRNTKVSVGDGEISLADHPVMLEALRVMSDLTGDDPRNIESAPSLSREDKERRLRTLTIELKENRNKNSVELDGMREEFRRLQSELYSEN